jgi:phosphoglycerate dehydrogenase-like enzyme
MKMIHLAVDKPNEWIWSEPFIQALRALGDLTIVPDAGKLPATEVAARFRGSDVSLSCWGTVPIPEEVAADPGNLKYACHITGTLRDCIPLAVIDAGIPVTNWGDAPANGLAEGAMSLLFAVMKDLHRFVLRQRGMTAEAGSEVVMGSLEEAPVGIYGLGVIGRRFVEMLRPFKPVIRVYDPYLKDLPEGCVRADSLAELFSRSRIVVIHAGLTDTTCKSVNADMLARMPDHGILINTARGAIVDHDALAKEVCAGRLRAGLDVSDPEPLPTDHPLARHPGCIFTPHCVAGSWPGDGVQLGKIHQVCLDNLRRFQRGEPVRFRMDRTRYLLST